MNFRRSIVISLFIFTFTSTTIALASTSDGTIDSSSRYAWSETMGWLDFGTLNGNVHVTNSELTGYIWAENAGWITLNCSNTSTCGTVDHKVANSNGTLSGYAFGENVGWIDFAPEGGGVSINSSGVFSGYAWSENAGWINFNLSNTPITDWRSSATTPQTTSPSSSSGGSGVLLPPEQQPPISPPPYLTTNLDPTITPPETEVPHLNLPTTSPPQATHTSQSISPSSDFTLPHTPVINTTITLFGLLAGMFIGLRFIFSSSVAPSEIKYTPSRIWGLFSFSTGIKKRFVPWGTVYDSVTKLPLDPAIVTVFDAAGNKVTDMITDLDGRYGYLLPVGTYTLTAGKTHYEFPSKKLRNRTSDEVYNDLYFGETFTITEEEPVVKKDIPLDPLEFDWNEFQKQKKHVMQFHSKSESVKLRIADILFTIGFAFSIFVIFTSTTPYNIGVLIVYVLLLIVRLLGRDPRAFGKVLQKITGSPVPFAIVRIYTTDRWTTLAQKITDEYGRYYCLVPKGTYAVTIDKKIEDGSYVKVLDDPKVDLKEGIIKTIFEI